MSTLPALTETVNDTFVSTWYEIRPTAVDNILDATPVTAALRRMGCFRPQVGGRYIERTIGYGEEDAEAFVKGDVLTSGEPELDTAAFWNWRYFGTHVQASLQDDQQNAGSFRIKDYVQRRLTAARNAMEQKLETRLLGTEVTGETGKEIQSLNDVVPSYSNRATGTFGKIARSNSWWQANYVELDAPEEVHLMDNFREAYRAAHNNQEPPNLIIAAENIFDLYEAFGEEKYQITMPAGGSTPASQVLNLGFDVLKYKNTMMIWSENMTDSNALFLNCNYIDVVYDPNYFMMMGAFKPSPITHERIAHIVTAINVVGSQPRRHCRLYSAS